MMEKRPTTALDRLSSLHDSVLLRILSFLPTNEAVKTCILSKRWRHAWTSVPDLNFVLTSPFDGDFIDQVLSHGTQSDVRRFRLDYSNCRLDLSYQVTTWVDYAVRHHVQELKINLDWVNKYTFLDSLINCQSLESLELKAALQEPLELPNPVCFSNLRVVNLSLTGRIPGEYMGKLISNCPILEDLSLTGEFDVLNISAPNRRKLRLIPRRTPELRFTCPRLELFEFVSTWQSGRFQGHMPSLVEARILDATGAQILRSLNNATILRFCPLEFEFCPGDLLDDPHKCLPTFHKLKHLCLISCFHVDNIESLVCLLKHTPNLNFLHIKQKVTAKEAAALRKEEVGH